MKPLIYKLKNWMFKFRLAKIMVGDMFTADDGSCDVIVIHKGDDLYKFIDVNKTMYEPRFMHDARFRLHFNIHQTKRKANV